MEFSDNKLFVLLINTLKACFEQIFWLFGPLFLIGFAIYFICNLRNKVFAKSVGNKVELLINGWIGIPVHEMAHTIFCVIFRHKIVEAKYFSLNTEDAAGFVKHEFNPKSSFQKIGNFFIGISPMLFGAVVIFAMLGIFLPQYLPTQLSGNIAETGFGIFKNFFNIENFSNWRFWVFIYLSIGVASYAKLSAADFKGAAGGFITLLCLIFLINFIANLIFSFGLKSIYLSALFAMKMNVLLALFYSIMLYMLVLSIIYLAFAYMIYGFYNLFNKIRSKF